MSPRPSVSLAASTSPTYSSRGIARGFGLARLRPNRLFSCSAAAPSGLRNHGSICWRWPSGSRNRSALSPRQRMRVAATSFARTVEPCPAQARGKRGVRDAARLYRDHGHDRNLDIFQIVQALLGRPCIEGALALLQSEVRIEGDTRIRVVDANRRMIDAQRDLAGQGDLSFHVAGRSSCGNCSNSSGCPSGSRNLKA